MKGRKGDLGMRREKRGGRWAGAGAGAVRAVTSGAQNLASGAVWT